MKWRGDIASGSINIFADCTYLAFNHLSIIWQSIYLLWSTYIWLDVWESEFFVTRGVILKSVLFEFFFSFLDKYVSKALGFFIFFTKSFFFPDFQQYLYIRVVNFSTLKMYELKLYIFWLFRVQTSKSNICI